MIIEGEEESGSLHFATLLRGAPRRPALRRRRRVSDTGMYGRDDVSSCVGMRGLVECQLDVHGPAGDLHSGSFGGAVPNPATVLAAIVARLHDENGHVTLPGFYDNVIPLTDRERELLARLPLRRGALAARRASRRAPYGETGYSTSSASGRGRPPRSTASGAATPGPGGKTIIPSEAHVKLSFRLVAGQEPGRGRGQRSRPGSVADAASRPASTRDVDARAAASRPLPDAARPPRAAERDARDGARVRQPTCCYTREGGSGPEAALAAILDAPVVFLGVGLPDDRIHAPNEKADIELLLAGAEAAAYLWTDLATTWDR